MSLKSDPILDEDAPMTIKESFGLFMDTIREAGLPGMPPRTAQVFEVAFFAGYARCFEDLRVLSNRSGGVDSMRKIKQEIKDFTEGCR